MNEELFKELEKYDKLLRNALKGFIHGVSRKDAEYLDKIASLLGTYRGSLNCPSCILKTAKGIAQKYIEFETIILS